MASARSSYEYHSRIESFSSFCRREAKSIAIFGGGFVVLTIAAILIIDPAFFYPRLQTDPLNYWLKAKSLVETGSTSARWAVNIPPFAYAAMPGVLRAPFLLLFHDFDAQLRAIQFANIPIVGGVALISSYVLSWALPPRHHRLAIAYAFLFTVFSPVWMANVFLPLVDAPYALFTLIAIVLSVRIIYETRTAVRRTLIGLFLLTLAIAFPLRFTAPVLLVFGATLLAGKSGDALVKRRKTVLAIAGMAVVLALLVLLNWNAIFGRYFRELEAFAVKGEKPGMVLNVLAAAIPSQVVPNFMQGFVYVPIDQYFKASFFGTPMQAAWTMAGVLTSAIAIAGAWKSRGRFLPEILYLLASLPVLGLMMPSTSRYLKSYQGFVWIFFFSGAAWIYGKNRERIPPFMRTRSFAVAGAFALAAMVIGIRSWRFVGTASEKKFAVGVSRAPDYLTDVSATFRGLRQYLETLPADRTLLVSDKGSMGRWKAIAGRDYYYPDTTMKSVASNKDLYLIVECGTMEGCQIWDEWRSKLEQRVDKFGQFRYDSVYAIARPRARAEVYRIRNTE
ncbi:MAG TPA: hypothetical protein VF042_10475 [Gemmatimonadaceae bacterium]